MAKAARIDDVVFGSKDADGDIFCVVKFTAGAHPLPVASGGQSVRFRTEEELVNALTDVEDRVSTDDLMLLQLAVAYKADARYGATFKQRSVGKSVIVDTTGLASAISLG